MVMLFDQYNLSEDVYEIVFSTPQQVDVAKLLIRELKDHNGVLTKAEMSDFATRLHDGITVKVRRKIGVATKVDQLKLSYNKRQFYDRILTPMKGMGMIDYDLYNKHYKVSEQFTKTINKVAQMWVSESKRPAIKLSN